MSAILRHIQYLAATTDCVIIPGWGGLIASHHDAALADGSFLPPVRSLVFNPALSHDDGRLAASLSRVEKIPYELARAEIATEVASMRGIYEASGQLTLPRIGTFSRAADGSMIFRADSRCVAGARYSYLPALTIDQPHEVPINMEEPEEPQVHIMKRESLGRRILRVAAFVAILLGLALTLSTPISVNLPAKPDFASVGTLPVMEASPEADVPVSAHLVIAIPDSALAIVPVAAKPQPAPDAPAKYYLIIGSLTSRREAEKWIETRPEQGLGIIERQGKYRVFAATGQTIEEAMALKSDAEFNRRNPEAWVYRRR